MTTSSPTPASTELLPSPRPVFHFTPPHGWMNDPNGLVYFQGRWHLFYQYYDRADVDGMQWGHAVSADLFHWQYLPPAIRPDQHGQIWSGSAVVDHHDSSGLFGGKAGIVCLFTYWDKADHRQCQGMAYSADGSHFQTYAGNPVIPQLRRLAGHPDEKDFRDPKVFWHAPTARWVMAVAGGKLRIFTSDDLIHWEFASVAEDLQTECPDLFAVPVDGDAGQTKWVLSGGGRWYMVGRFDGRRFTPESDRIPMIHGPDYYATQTWSDAPGGRRIGIAWLFSWTYGCAATTMHKGFPITPWAGNSQTVPVEFSLVSTHDGIRLKQQVVGEFDQITRPLLQLEPRELAPTTANPLAALAATPLDIRLNFRPPASGRFVLRLLSGATRTHVLRYDAAKQMLSFDRTQAGFNHVQNFPGIYDMPLPPDSHGRVALRILLDYGSVEIFGNDGAAAMSVYILPAPDAGGPVLAAKDGVFQIESLTVRSLI